MNVSLKVRGACFSQSRPTLVPNATEFQPGVHQTFVRAIAETRPGLWSNPYYFAVSVNDSDRIFGEDDSSILEFTDTLLDSVVAELPSEGSFLNNVVQTASEPPQDTTSEDDQSQEQISHSKPEREGNSFSKTSVTIDKNEIKSKELDAVMAGWSEFDWWFYSPVKTDCTNLDKLFLIDTIKGGLNSQCKFGTDSRVT